MDFENINQKLGGCGRYQYIIFFLLSITTFKYSGECQAMIFALYVPKFRCFMWTNRSLENKGTPLNYTSNDQCKYKISLNDSWMPCTRWAYDKDVLKTSLIAEFDIVCDRAYLREIMFTTYFIGNLCGYLLVMFNDMIGRRYALIISLYLSIFITILQIFANSLLQHATILFLNGLFKSIYITLAFTTLIELIPLNSLDIATCNFWILCGVNYMSCSMFAYYGRSWRTISICSLALTIFYFFYFCFVPETPRWLMLNQKRDESYNIMSFIAKINHRTFTKSDIDDWRPVQQKTGKFWNLFKYKVMVIRLLISSFVSWSFAFSYTGSSTDLKFASDNIFISTFVMGFIETIISPFSGFLANKFGRKKTICSLSCLAIFGLVTMAFLDPDPLRSVWQPWLKIICAMAAKLGFTSGCVVFCTFINELLPTSDRNSGNSLVYGSFTIGSIISPMVHTITGRWYYAAPCLGYSFLLVITVVLVIFFFPETHHLPVPQTIEQAASLIIYKEQEWKSNLIFEAQKLGMGNTSELVVSSLKMTET